MNNTFKNWDEERCQYNGYYVKNATANHDILTINLRRNSVSYTNEKYLL